MAVKHANRVIMTIDSDQGIPDFSGAILFFVIFQAYKS